jgi:hypothetical protein
MENGFENLIKRRVPMFRTVDIFVQMLSILTATTLVCTSAVEIKTEKHIPPIMSEISKDAKQEDQGEIIVDIKDKATPEMEERDKKLKLLDGDQVYHRTIYFQGGKRGGVEINNPAPYINKRVEIEIVVDAKLNPKHLVWLQRDEGYCNSGWSAMDGENPRNEHLVEVGLNIENIEKRMRDKVLLAFHFPKVDESKIAGKETILHQGAEIFTLNVPEGVCNNEWTIEWSK